MSLLESVRKEFMQPGIGTDKTDKSPSVSSVSTKISRAELKIAAADDWEAIKDAPQVLEAFRRQLETTRMIDAGIVPPDYTSTTHCKHCGDVPIFEGCSEEVYGCPWCFVGGYRDA